MAIVQDETIIMFLEANDKASQIIEGIGKKFGIVGKEAAAAGDEGAAADAKMAEGGQAVAASNEEAGLSFSRLKTLGVGAGVALVAGLGAVAAISIKQGLEMQNLQAKLASTAGISLKSAASIGAAFTNTIGTSVDSGKELLQAYQPVAAQLGLVQGKALSAKQALDFMTVADTAAVASGSSLSAVTTALSSIMSTYHAKLSDATQYSNELFQASNALNIGFPQLTQQITRIVGRMGAMAPPLGQVSGLLLDFAHNGESGRMAMRTLGQAMQQYVTKATGVDKAILNNQAAYNQLSPAMKKVANEYRSGTMTSLQFLHATQGMTTHQAALMAEFKSTQDAIQSANLTYKEAGVSLVSTSGKIQSLSTVMAELYQKTKGMGDSAQAVAIAQQVFGSSAIRMLKIIEAGPQAFQKYTAAVEAHGAAEKGAAKIQSTLHYQMQVLHASLADITEIIGAKLVPVLMMFVNAAMPVVRVIIEWVGKHAMLVMAIFGAIAAIVLITAAVAAFQMAWEAAMSPIVGIVVGIVAVIAVFILLYTHVKAFREIVNRVFNDVRHFILMVVGAITTFIKQHWDTIRAVTTNIWNAIKNVIVVVWDIISTTIGVYLTIIIGIITVAVNVIIDVVKGIIAIVSFLVGVWQTVTSDVAHFIGGVVKFFTDLPGNIMTGINDVKNTVVNTLRNAWNTATTDIGNFINNIIKFFTGLPGKIVNAIKGLGKDIGGVLNSIPGIGGVFKAIGLATGGPLAAGQVAVVGEQGPELFIPKMSGTVIPNGGMRAATTGGLASGGGAGVYIDLRGSQIMSDADLQRFATRIGSLLTRTVFTSAGIRQTGR